MKYKNIPYQSFCWVIGTTSFRTAKLNLKIEQQLLLLDEFQKKIADTVGWTWDNKTQVDYYDFMKAKQFLYGDAKRKDKDAREKTSGLVDIGLITTTREITPAGRKLLEIASAGEFDADIVFNIDDDSYVYLKQLLKTTIKVGASDVRPLIVLIKCLIDLEYLSFQEFTYFVPLIIGERSYEEIVSNIRLHRQGKINVDDVIYSQLMAMENYQEAYKEFMTNKVDEALIMLIGMNRKSRNYDRPYCDLFRNLRDFFVDGSTNYEELFHSVKNIKQYPGFLWSNLIFKIPRLSSIRKNREDSISGNCPFLHCSSEADLKNEFFKYMHVFKAMATLNDYFDLNRRYMNLTDIFVFEDETIKLDLFPKYYFKEIINRLFSDAFFSCNNLYEDISLDVISDAFDIDLNVVYQSISQTLGVAICNPEQASSFIMEERYKRFNHLIDKRFNDATLIELLECFENRDDRRIEELVTDDAAIPTIFEYILGVIWYKVSKREGNILDFMKLSLEANLLPKTHAAGGNADIIYEYNDCETYPKHSLLIEATLTDATNQRRMEMEPVSRHLGDYRLRSKNPYDYSLFISTYLHKNVVIDFRYRKNMPYLGSNGERLTA